MTGDIQAALNAALSISGSSWRVAAVRRPKRADRWQRYASMEAAAAVSRDLRLWPGTLVVRRAATGYAWALWREQAGVGLIARGVQQYGAWRGEIAGAVAPREMIDQAVATAWGVMTAPPAEPVDPVAEARAARRAYVTRLPRQAHDDLADAYQAARDAGARVTVTDLYLGLLAVQGHKTRRLGAGARLADWLATVPAGIERDQWREALQAIAPHDDWAEAEAVAAQRRPAVDVGA